MSKQLSTNGQSAPRGQKIDKSMHDNISEKQSSRLLELHQQFESAEYQIIPLKQNHWLLGTSIILRRGPAKDAVLKDGQTGFGYGIEIVDNPPRPNSTCRERPMKRISIKYPDYWSDGSVCWQIGESIICKISPTSGRSITEETILRGVQENMKQHDWSFSVPNPIHTLTVDGFRYFFMEKARGKPLAKVWPLMTGPWKQFVSSTLTKSCEQLEEVRLDWFSSTGRDDIFQSEGSKENLGLENKRERNGDFIRRGGEYVFQHNRLNPDNVLVDLSSKHPTITITGWRYAGYVPRENVASFFQGLSMVLSPKTQRLSENRLEEEFDISSEESGMFQLAKTAGFGDKFLANRLSRGYY